MDEEKNNVAIICENTETYENLKRRFLGHYENIEVHHFKSADQAVKGIFPLRPRLIVTEWDFSTGTSGEEFLQSISRDKFVRAAPVYILSALPKSGLDLQELDQFKTLEVFQVPVEPRDLAEKAAKDAGFKLKSVRYRDLEAGEVLFSKGDKADFLCIVQKGELRVFIEENGKRTDLATVGERRVVGEMAFFDPKSERSASVEAKTPAQVIELTIAGFHEYLEKQPPWLKIMVESLVTNLRAANQKLLEKS